MTPEIVAANEGILAAVERLGGGYVWEAEIFAVTLIDVPVTDQQAAALAQLVGVQQIALNASRLSSLALHRVARIRGLKSLVLSDLRIAEAELSELKRVGPEIRVVAHEA